MASLLDLSGMSFYFTVAEATSIRGGSASLALLCSYRLSCSSCRSFGTRSSATDNEPRCLHNELFSLVHTVHQSCPPENFKILDCCSIECAKLLSIC